MKLVQKLPPVRRSLHQLNVSGREKADASAALSLPPALVNHLDVGDDVLRVEGDLVVGLCVEEDTKAFVRTNVER